MARAIRAYPSHHQQKKLEMHWMSLHSYASTFAHHKGQDFSLLDSWKDNKAINIVFK